MRRRRSSGSGIRRSGAQLTSVIARIPGACHVRQAFQTLPRGLLPIAVHLAPSSFNFHLSCRVYSGGLALII